MDHSPFFLLGPVNNDRTAWRPFGLPAILVIPHRRSTLGDTLTNSNVFNVRIYIEDVPTKALVAGPENIGIRFPTQEIYSKSLLASEVTSKLIDLSGVTYFRDGVEIDKADAIAGDVFSYTTDSGVQTTIEYEPTADYVDLSSVLLDLETLPPNRYDLVYSAQYYKRITSQTFGPKQFICLDDSIGLAQLRFNINHPGDIMGEFHRMTPAVNLTSEKKSQDKTLEFYRPFTDVLQDAMDEQTLLKSINWVNNVPVGVIQYMAPLLGWELPFFPNWLDGLRRTMLKNVSYLQTLKGSQAGISELFRLFDLKLLINKLWWSEDGKRLIRPGERLPAGYEDQRITLTDRGQVDLLLDEWSGPGYGQYQIPLLFRPAVIETDAGITAASAYGDVTIDAYTVVKDSDAHLALQSLAAELRDDPTTLSSSLTTDRNGYYTSDLQARLTGLEVAGYSQMQLSGKLRNVRQAIHVGDAPLTKHVVSLDPLHNRVNFSLGHYFDDADKVVYAFASYKCEELDVPAALADLHSNKFDMRIVVPPRLEGSEQAVIDFALEFLNKVKSIHSLLRSVVLSIELTENYEATDLCVGYDAADRYDTDFGNLQVPPAIIPAVPSELRCKALTPQALGYKESDLLFRLRKYDSLIAEYNAWKNYDDREVFTTGASRLPPAEPNGRDECRYNSRGQDRIEGERVENSTVEYGPAPNASQLISGQTSQLTPVSDVADGEFDAISPKYVKNKNGSGYAPFVKDFTDVRTGHCADTPKDFCYKGRVDDESMYSLTVPSTEMVSNRGCAINFGGGFYWTYPTVSERIVAGTMRPGIGSHTSKNFYSGKTATTDVVGHLSKQTSSYLSYDYAKPLDKKTNSTLGRLYRAYDVPETTIHFDNRPAITSYDQRQMVALQRPSIDVQKDTFHFPGCRFAAWGNLESDYTSEIWKAKPWDPQYSTACGPRGICGTNEPSWLNAVLVVGTDGDEYLEFDDVPYFVAGNGLPQDIPSFGSHASSYDVTTIHKVYSVANTGHSAISFDTTEFDADTTSVVSTALFNSARVCDGGGTSPIYDFTDGYAALSGWVDTDIAEVGYGMEPAATAVINLPNGDQVVYTGQDLTFTNSSGNPLSIELIVPDQALFLFGSGILDGSSGLRFGCGCVVSDCGTEPGEAICSLDQYYDSDDELDLSPDHVSMTPYATFVDSIGAGIVFDGTIPTYMQLASANVWPSSGSFVYRDDYDVIYETEWTYADGILDVTTVTKDPKVNGLGRKGYVENKIIYRWGLITVKRQRLRALDEGYEIISEGFEESLGYYVASNECRVNYDGDFRHYHDQMVTDSFEYRVLSGPAFVDVDDDNDVVWGEVTDDGSVLVPVSGTLFEFIGPSPTFTILTEDGVELLDEDGESMVSE